MSKRTCAVLIAALLAAPLATALAAPAVKAEEVKKVTEAAPSRSTVGPKAKRKILVFYRCEGFRHRSIPIGNKAFEIMGVKTGAFDVVVSDDMAMFTAEKLKGFDAVLLNNTTRLKFTDPERRKALLDFVKGGKGLIGIHAASDNFYDWPEGAAMIGGLFSGHPWGGGGTWAVKIDEPNHPLNKAFGGKGFKIKDEMYQFKAPYSRDKLRVLLSLDLSDKATGSRKGNRQDKDYAVSWIQQIGKGRMFYCGLGHNNPVFWNKAVLQHFLDGIQYALGDLEADATPSNKVSKPVK